MSYSDALDTGNYPAFKFEATGDYIVGRVDYLDEFTSDKYPSAKPTAVLGLTVTEGKQNGAPLTPGEQFSLFGFGAYLSSRIEKSNPQEGDLVGAKFKGTVKSRTPGYADAKDFGFKIFERGALGAQLEAARVEAAVAEVRASAPEPVQLPTQEEVKSAVQAVVDPEPDEVAELREKLAAAEAAAKARGVPVAVPATAAVSDPDF